MVFSIALAIASPALAQGVTVGDQILLDDLRMRQQAAERRAVEQANQLMALEARLQAERAVQDLRMQATPPALPRAPYASPSPDESSALAKFPSVPDAALAESNRRVREAAANRR
ncbi:MAG: hypothetical protein ACOY5Y_04220 [Pseudomonadota bacterium]